MFNKLKRAQNPHTDYVTLRGMVNSRNWKIRAALAGNSNLQSYLFIELAEDKNSAVRTALSTNPNLSHKAWAILKEDNDNKVVETLLVNHPNQPEKGDHRK